MLVFIVRRLAIFLPMLFFISVLTFVLIQLPPGDFIDDYAAMIALGASGGTGPASFGEEVDKAELEFLRKRYGLDQPIYVQYLKWLRGVLTWDLGLSFIYRIPVNELINDRLTNTLILSVFTVLFTWTLAIPVGIISAVKQYSWIDYIFTFLSYFGIGTPNFMIALVALWLVFTIWNEPLGGLFSREYIDAPWSFGKFIDLLKHLWVPMIIVGTDGTARLTRIVRANLLDELGKPYVEAARSRGTGSLMVVVKYPTRIALNPFISVVGWTLPSLFSGSLIIAVVLALPTIGPLLLEALRGQDMYMAGSILLVLSFLTLVGTLVSDILLAWADPRIRYGGAQG